MKLSEFKNEAAIELLADIIEPTSVILTDEKMRRVIKSLSKGKTTRIVAVGKALKWHPKEVVEILARLDGKEPKEYECNVLSLPKKLLEILNDKELSDFFTSQVQMTESESSGLPMENTGAGEQ